MLPEAGTIGKRISLGDHTMTQSINQQVEVGDVAISVAFQGERGAFGDEAVRAYFGRKAGPLPYRSFSDVFQAVASCEGEYGLVPVENSHAGTVKRLYDFLRQHSLFPLGATHPPLHPTP